MRIFGYLKGTCEIWRKFNKDLGVLNNLRRFLKFCGLFLPVLENWQVLRKVLLILEKMLSVRRDFGLNLENFKIIFFAGLIIVRESKFFIAIFGNS
jgi:hypothetical protein